MTASPAPSPSLESSPAPSPFAMGEDHEFPDDPRKKLNDQLTELTAVTKAVLTPAAPPPPALPGTPLSPYRRCPCVGALPGRVCIFCSGTKWTRICPRCQGEGRRELNIRRGAERSEPCGFCGQKGILPASQQEIDEATRLAEKFAAGPEGRTLVVDDSTAEPEFRRAVRLPGIGVTATKRIGTLDARKRERERLAKRTKKRKKEKKTAAKAKTA